MVMILLAMILALGSAVTFKKMRQKPPSGLRPNCLLTRYPICFVHGLKTIFCAFDYWHGVPDYLKSHGYEIYVFKGPWRGPHEKRLEAFSGQFREVLKNYPKVHVVAHSLGAMDMLDIISKEEFQDRFSSVTFVSPPFGGSPFAQLGLLFGEKFFQSTNETVTVESAQKILKRFKKPENILIGTIISRPGKYPLSSQVKAQHHLLKAYLKRKNLNEENDGLVPLESQRLAESLGKVFFEFPGDHVQVIGGGPWPEFEKTAHGMFLDHAIFLAEYDFKTAQ
jgi:triacylglycerol esterase/lipase EstA (alpha/beta hydrolase family)